VTPGLKSKVFNLLLILTSLIGYLEWGIDNTSFLFQAEGEIIIKLFTDPISAVHPFTLIPLAGQIILFITLFQKKLNSFLTFTGMASIGILLIFMFAIGLMGLNYRILLSTIPFLVVAVLTVRHHKQIKRAEPKAVNTRDE
jgi:hypothetical protein